MICPIMSGRHNKSLEFGTIDLNMADGQKENCAWWKPESNLGVGHCHIIDSGLALSNIFKMLKGKE